MNVKTEGQNHADLFL